MGLGTGDIPQPSQAQRAAFQAVLPGIGNRPYLLFLSRIHRKKGCDLLIEAFARVARDFPEHDLVMAGPDQMGWQPELMDLARERGIAERIHWPGMLTGDAKWGAFQDCAAFVLPSHQENFGIAVAEALAAAKPVITTTKVNIWREIDTDSAGIIGENTAPSTEASLRRLLALGLEERAAMGARARACFECHFEISASASALAETIRELM